MTRRMDNDRVHAKAWRLGEELRETPARTRELAEELRHRVASSRLWDAWPGSLAGCVRAERAARQARRPGRDPAAA